jgi:Ca2+-binding RTX toxin-like protein
MRSTRVLLLPLLVSAVVLAPAGAAYASETVGSNLAGTPNAGPALDTTTFQTVQPTGVTMPLTPTTSGVIVKIVLKHGVSGADPGIYGFRILSGTLPILTARTPVEFPQFTAPANATPGTLTFVPTANGVIGGTPKGIPIAAGERLAMARLSGVAGQGLEMRTNGAPGAERRTTPSAHNSGSADYTSAVAASENLWQFVVEPDADLDGYGDESQDLCPSDATRQTACVPPPVPCKGQQPTISGTPGNDTLKGTPGKDVIQALAGNDKISGAGSNDVICAGAGNDRLKGGGGADKLYGGPGGDLLRGNGGADVLKGQGGKDRCPNPGPDVHSSCAI